MMAKASSQCLATPVPAKTHVPLEACSHSIFIPLTPNDYNIGLQSLEIWGAYCSIGVGLVINGPNARYRLNELTAF